jgi:hypothetical protein
MSCQYHTTRLDHFNYTSRKIKVMTLLIMQFSPTSCHLISLRSKYSSQHPALKHPQSTFLYEKRRRFAAMRNNIKMYLHTNRLQRTYWIQLFHVRIQWRAFVIAVMKIRIAWKDPNFVTPSAATRVAAVCPFYKFCQPTENIWRDNAI